MTGAKPDERIRTPMRWDASQPAAGFSTAEPWEPLSADPASVNVADESGIRPRYWLPPAGRPAGRPSGAVERDVDGGRERRPVLVAALRTSPLETALVLTNVATTPVYAHARAGLGSALRRPTVQPALGDGPVTPRWSRPQVEAHRVPAGGVDPGPIHRRHHLRPVACTADRRSTRLPGSRTRSSPGVSRTGSRGGTGRGAGSAQAWGCATRACSASRAAICTAWRTVSTISRTRDRRAVPEPDLHGGFEPPLQRVGLPDRGSAARRRRRAPRAARCRARPRDPGRPGWRVQPCRAWLLPVPARPRGRAAVAVSRLVLPRSGGARGRPDDRCLPPARRRRPGGDGLSLLVERAVDAEAPGRAPAGARVPVGRRRALAPVRDRRLAPDVPRDVDDPTFWPEFRRRIRAVRPTRTVGSSGASRRSG